MGIADKFFSWFEEAAEGDEGFRERQGLYELEGKSTARVIKTPSERAQYVVICALESFEEAQTMVDHLKQKKQIILNLENTEDEMSRKVLDFVHGAVYGLEGHSQQLGQKVYLFAPSAVEIF